MIHKKPIPKNKIVEKLVSAWPVTGFIGALALFGLQFALSSDTVQNAKPLPTLETLIPEGFQLIPIEVSNSESLDSVFGNYGFVDLYATGSGAPSPASRVAQAVKLLRAPLNPRQFAVLVHSEQAADIVHQGPSYFVVLQNLQKPGTVFEAAPVKPSSRIVIEGGHRHD